MSRIDSNSLRMLVTQALERTAFVIVDPCDEQDAGRLAPATHFARIDYAGPESGSVYLQASPGFLTELASSILGAEPDEIRLDVEGLDALRELANIVGGSAVVALGGESLPYALRLPETLDGPPTDLADAVTCTVESMGERLTVSWRPHAAARQAA